MNSEVLHNEWLAIRAPPLCVMVINEEG